MTLTQTSAMVESSPPEIPTTISIVDMGQVRPNRWLTLTFLVPFIRWRLDRFAVVWIDLPVKIIGARGFKGNSPVGTVFKQV